MPSAVGPVALVRRLAVAGALALVLVPLAPRPAAAADLDYGDAPAGYDTTTRGPARAVVGELRLGAAVTPDRVDPETGVSTHASASALSDPGDDGLAPVAPIPAGRLLRTGVDVRVSGVSGPTRLCGWLDFDLDGTFSTGERSCADLAAGATAAHLEWVGRPAAPGRSYLRLRLGTAAAQVGEATGAAGPGEVEDHPVRFVAPPPVPSASLALVVTPTPRTVSAPGPVALAYVVRNDGQLPVRGVRVADESLAGAPSCPDGPVDLAPGASTRCTATVQVDQAAVDAGGLELAAEARGERPDGDPADPSDDVVAVGPARVGALQQPAVALTVGATPSRPRPGQRVRLEYRVTSTGNLTLGRVRVVADDRAEGLRCRPAAPATLAPGAELTCTASTTVTAADARRGRFAVRATVRAERPYGSPTSTADDVTARASLSVLVARAAAPGPGVSPTPSPGGGGPTATAAPTAPSGSPRSTPTPVPGPSPTTGAGAGLATTGGSAAALAALVAGVLAVLVGAGLLLLGRHRRRRAG